MLVEALAADGTRWTIQAQRPPMQVGLTCSAADFGTHGEAFPKAACCRVFAGPGEGLPAWGSPELRLPAGWRPWISFKDWPAEQVLWRWLDGVTRPVTVTWQHERDNDRGAVNQTAKARAEHFARWRDLYAVIKSHPKRPLVQAMPIQTLQWTAARSSLTAVKGDSNWRHWWAGVGDGVAWDCYVDSWAATYPDPEKWLRIPFEAAEGAGRPLWLPELGSVLLGGDTGAGRASWIRDVLTVLRLRGCAGVAWWCAYGTPGAKGEVRDFHLHDKASADVWRAATESN